MTFEEVIFTLRVNKDEKFTHPSFDIGLCIGLDCKSYLAFFKRESDGTYWQKFCGAYTVSFKNLDGWEAITESSDLSHAMERFGCGWDSEKD